MPDLQLELFPWKKLWEQEIKSKFHHCPVGCGIFRVRMLSHVRLFAPPWTGAFQAALSMKFSRQEYWSGLPFPFWGNLPHWGIEPASFESPALAGGFFTNCTTKGLSTVTVNQGDAFLINWWVQGKQLPLWASFLLPVKGQKPSPELSWYKD